MELMATRDPEIFRIRQVIHFDHRFAVGISLLFVGSFFAIPAIFDSFSGWFPKIAASLMLLAGGRLIIWRRGVIINLRDREIIRGWGPLFMIIRKHHSLNPYTTVVLGPRTRKLPNPIFSTYPIYLDREGSENKILIVDIPDILDALTITRELAEITSLDCTDLTDPKDLPTVIFT